MEQGGIQHYDSRHWLSEFNNRQIQWTTPLGIVNIYEAEIPPSLQQGYYRPGHHSYAVAQTETDQLIPLFIKVSNTYKDNAGRGYQLMQRIDEQDNRIGYPYLLGIVTHNEEFQVLEYVDGLVPISLLNIRNKFQFQRHVAGVMGAVEALLEQDLIMYDLPLLQNFGYVESDNSYWVFDIESIGEITAANDENRDLVRAYALMTMLYQLYPIQGLNRLEDIKIKTQVVNEYLEQHDLKSLDYILGLYMGKVQREYLKLAAY